MPENTAVAPSTSSGWGRILVAVYAVLALAATGRSSVQLTTHAADAPVPYGLSALAALVYVAATVALAKGGAWRRVAWAAVLVETVGVLVVGTVSVVHADWFPDDTVWSYYGIGYGFAPLVLPFLGIAWLRRTAPR